MQLIDSVSCLFHTRSRVTFPKESQDPEYKNDLKRILLKEKKPDFITFWKENPGEKYAVQKAFTDKRMRILHGSVRYFLLMNCMGKPNQFLELNSYYGFLGEEFLARSFEYVKKYGIDSSISNY